MIPWLDPLADFPSPDAAPTENGGLICAGGDLSPARLLAAYRRGIFPWFSPGDPILWWSPDPRMVLVPEAFKPSRSLRQAMKKSNIRVCFDADFTSVIRACAAMPRKGQDGTWISPEMQTAYIDLFELGFAHSVETYLDGTLVGGLYGVAIGKMFYGESMFSRVDNASKIALAHLARFLSARSFGMIDCQMSTRHLQSLGARDMPRAGFLRRVKALTAMLPEKDAWPADGGALSILG